MVDTSVIIPCYNSADTLGLQLESLSRQQDCAPFEVVIVDNCSTDATGDIALGWDKKLNLRIVVANDHQGVSYARNRGIAEATGQKLIFVDADDAVPPEYIGYCQRSLDEYPVYVGGFDLVDDAEFFRGLDHVLGLVAHKTLDYKSPLPSEQDPFWPVVPGGSFGALKSVMLEVGGFDITMEPGAEDNDLAFRLISAGYELRVQRSTTIAYRTNNQQRPFSVYYKRAKSVALLAERHKVWNRAPVSVRKPVKNFLITLGAGTKILLIQPKNIKGWLPRLAMSSGLLGGWVSYRVLKCSRPPRLGVGL